VKLVGCEFTNNGHLPLAGGLQAAATDPAEDLTSVGGAVYLHAAKDADYEINLVISECRFDSNAAGNTGGAISTNQFGVKVASIEVYDSDFINNAVRSAEGSRGGGGGARR
jgi:predicted outer membrane repeat protein